MTTMTTRINFCTFAFQNIKNMDFFERHYKKIAVGWLFLLFLFWLVPRVVGVNNHSLDPGQAGLMYIILFGIAISAFALVAFIEIVSSKNYKRVKKLFFVIVVPLMLLAIVGVYRLLWDWGVPIPFQNVEKAKNEGVFYAEYEVIPKEVCVDDKTIIRFEEAIGQYERDKDKSRFFDFPKYTILDRKCIVLNCSYNDSSLHYHELIWDSDDADYILGPIRYGKKGKPMVKIPLKKNASDTILITIGKLNSLDIIDSIPPDHLDTIRLVKR